MLVLNNEQIKKVYVYNAHIEKVYKGKILLHQPGCRIIGKGTSDETICLFAKKNQIGSLLASIRTILKQCKIVSCSKFQLAASDCYALFMNFTNLEILDLSNFDATNITSTSYMFASCIKLSNLDISNFDFTNVNDSSSMFHNVPANCLILVKDQAAKNFVLSQRSDFSNVVIKELKK